MILLFSTIILFSIIIIFLISNCSLCKKSYQNADEIESPYVQKLNDDVPNYINDNSSFQNPEPAHPSQIPNDQDSAEFPSITSQIEAVSINSSSTTSRGKGERLQTSVLVYPPNS